MKATTEEGEATELVDAFAPTQAAMPVEVNDVAPAPDMPTIVFSRASVRRDARELTAPHAEATLSSAEPEDAARRRARYVVVGSVGKGGMGTVHLARDVSLLRRVALKELSPEASREPAAAGRFLREVQVTAQLDHPNIVPVYSLEVAPGGLPAYAMKLVEGITFEALVQQTRAFHEGGRQPDEAHSLPVRLEHFLKACDAVAYAHDRGVLHRDLKPPNLMLGPHNEVYVMDWGICRVLGRDGAPDEPPHTPATPDAHGAGARDAEPVSADTSARTQLGTVVGTPMYMSPEQARGDRALDGRSDLCALGLILFKLVTLRSPFPGKTGFEVLYQAVHGQLRPMEHEFGERIAPELRAIVERATALEPRRRYQSVHAFAADLRRFLRGEAIEARPDTAWEKLLRRAARRRQAVGIAVLAVLAAGSLSLVGLMWRHERALAEQRFRESRLAAATAELAREGDVLQTRVLEVMGELDAFAAVASSALLHGEAASGPLAGLDAGADPAGAGGTFTADPAADPVTVRRLAGRLRAAEPQGRELLTRAMALLGNDASHSAPLDLRIGLEAGLAYRWPAPQAASPAVHPRTRPWYQAAAASAHPHWGEAYIDRDAVRVPFGVRIQGPRGEMLGVVSLVFAPGRLLDGVLGGQGLPGARATLLLSPKGRVLAATQAGSASTSWASPLADFGEPRLDTALASAAQGVCETTAFGARELLVYDRVDPFGWTLVTVLPESALLAPVAEARAPRAADSRP